MLHFSTLQQFDIQLADFLVILSSFGILLMLVPAVLLTPSVAAVTESFTFQKHKAFYSKCARQITQTVFGIGLMLFTILCTGAMITLLQFKPDIMTVEQMWRPILIVASPMAAMLLLTIYLSTWSKLKKRKGTHLFLGFLAAGSCLAILFLILLFLVSLVQPIEIDILWVRPLELLRELCAAYFSAPLLWLLTAYLVFTGIAAGLGLSQLWLIMRRYKDDYGRDYYNFAMRYCAKISLVCTLIATIIGAISIWLLVASSPLIFLQPQDRGVLLIAFGLPISCCVLWACILKSETPMRHKPGAFFACLFFFLALCAQVFFYLSAVPML